MRGRTNHLILTGLFAALTAVGAFLRFPLGLSSVTLQFLFTALSGLLLGPKWGALSQTVYVALGLCGLPVFTMGGGPGYLLQPSFGFLLGLIPAAWTAGRLGHQREKPLPIFASCAASLAVLYLAGLPYMYLILHAYLGRDISPWGVVQAGMLIYLPGDLLKLLLLTMLCRPLSRALRRGQA